MTYTQYKIGILATVLCLIQTQTSWGAQGLDVISKDFKPQENSVIQVSNMPRVRSQDSAGICYSFVAASLIDEANCSSQKINDCTAVSDEQKVSALDISRFSKVLDSESDTTDRFNYEGLGLEGGATVFTLENALQSGSIAKESCAPFDQLVSNMSDPAKAIEIEKATWKRFEDAYKTYQKKTKSCMDCGLEYATAVGAQIKEEFKLKATNTDILDAFAQDTYSKFLDKLLVPDKCWDLKNQTSLKGNWTHKAYPEPNVKSNYDEYIKKIKEVLTKKRPLGIGFCTQTPLTASSIASCGKMKNGKVISGEGHAVIIKGYRKVCNLKNECRESLQVQNSWGQSWQNSNDDGWVDAKELISRTFYGTYSMTWLEPDAK